MRDTKISGKSLLSEIWEIVDVSIEASFSHRKARQSCALFRTARDRCSLCFYRSRNVGPRKQAFLRKAICAGGHAALCMSLLCVSVFLPQGLHVCLCFCLCTSVSLSLFLCFFPLLLHLSSVSLCLFSCLSASICVSLFSCLSVCLLLFFCLSVCIFLSLPFCVCLCNTVWVSLWLERDSCGQVDGYVLGAGVAATSCPQGCHVAHNHR